VRRQPSKGDATVTGHVQNGQEDFAMKQMNLMLVDDEERFLETTSKVLARKGYQALTAGSGPQALDLLLSHEVDVVVLDVKMPDMGGLAVLREIKFRFPLVEVIILTGHGAIETAVEGMKIGAFDYLTKPCDIDDLIAKAQDAFARKRATEGKIRSALTRKAVRSPRQLAREVDGTGKS
jgi:DNA-binding NtrC family response regulator